MKMKHVANRRRSVSSRTFIALLALVLVIGCVAGGTFAWLVATSGPVENTFTYGNINIELKETTGEQYKIVPGVDIHKNPQVTVKANSEDCWLFVKITKTGTLTGVSYEVVSGENGWTAFDGEEGVYYRSVANNENDQVFNVLVGNDTYTDGVITVSSDLTKAQVEEITGTQALTFKAYAVQKAGNSTAAEAWEKVTP